MRCPRCEHLRLLVLGFDRTLAPIALGRSIEPYATVEVSRARTADSPSAAMARRLHDYAQCCSAMSSSTTIADRSVLVTGANRGIGQALVEEALRRGAKRVYAGTRQPLTHPDERVTPLTLDVTDARSAR